MNVYRNLLILSATSVILACSSVSDHAREIVYQCGIQDVTATFANETVTLAMRGQQQQLQHVVAASGAHFKSNDGRTSYWNKGSEATITWHDENLPLCIEQGKLPNNVAFSGNEPFWLLTLNHDHVSYTTPEQELEFAANPAEYNDDNDWLIALSDAGEEVGQLRINSSICYDSMSGKAFPYSVKLVLQGNEYRGCGGETTQLIQGQPWQLSAMTGSSGSMLDRPSLQFLTEGRLVGTDGCNRFFGHYSVDGEIPRLSVQGATKRMCSQASMTFAQKFIENLNNTSKIDIKEDKLVLKVNSGQQLTFAPKY